MQKESEVTLSFSSELTPIREENSAVLFETIQDFAESLYDSRQTKVVNEQPLLSSEPTPLYEQTDLHTNIAYSIDIRNIHKWLNYFTRRTPAPPQTVETITFDLPPQSYDHLDDILFIQADQETAFEFDDAPPMDLNELETLLTFKYTPSTQTFEVTFEEDTTLQSDELSESIETEVFSTPYDLYQSHLDGADAELHEEFAVFSPEADYQTVTEHIDSVTDHNTMVVRTTDDWKVCAKAPEDQDYEVNLSVVELLNPVSDTIVEYHNEFTYSTKYIQLPELQYLSTVSNAYLSEREQQLLRALPYAIPFGDDEELEAKFIHAQKFTADTVSDDLLSSLRYEQFLHQSR